jgi:hypothetical protein
MLTCWISALYLASNLAMTGKLAVFVSRFYSAEESYINYLM